VVLSEQEVDHLFNETKAFSGYQLTIDLKSQEVIAPDGRRYRFEVTPFRKYCLQNGLDDIGLTLRHADKIKAFEAERILRMPWLATQLP
jgi:3-isopropylmalate/(R)-2-methylmalate dehydratase small subunit